MDLDSIPFYGESQRYDPMGLDLILFL